MYLDSQFDTKRFVIDQTSAYYPSCLLDLNHIDGDDAPTVLYGYGDPSLLSTPCMSVVGARKATAYGLAGCDMVARMCAAHSITVVSGGALGCDGRAHQAALQSGGSTIVVLGGGARVVYPRQHRALFERAVAQGSVIISQFGWDTPPARYTFIKRNRIIAALSKALVVCESGFASGTYSTAVTAEDLGRELLAIPGSIFATSTRGSNRLIADHGAHGIWSREWLESLIFSLYDHHAHTNAQQGVHQSQSVHDAGRDTLGLYSVVIDALRTGAQRPEELARIFACEQTSIIKELTALEVRGLAFRQHDGSFSATERLLAD